jgi:hypothetical protein
VTQPGFGDDEMTTETIRYVDEQLRAVRQYVAGVRGTQAAEVERRVAAAQRQTEAAVGPQPSEEDAARHAWEMLGRMLGL